ncbi:PucR family transcriptional regulator [Amycolatopsis sp. NPDC059027]|uniref:PucR family transcriptional regulator n=1 Tax=unclassified Amycolatopsis TaxID=2618356 RepID=UPI00367051FD
MTTSGIGHRDGAHLGSASLAVRLADRMPCLLDAMVRRILTEVPYYRQLPEAEIEVDVRGIAEFHLGLVTRMLREDRMPTGAELAVVTRSAARRAEEGIPLRLVLAANYAGAGAAWEVVSEYARGDEVAAVVAIGSRMLRYLLTLSTAVTEGFMETTLAVTGRDREIRGQLFDAVLTGRETPELWENAGLAPWRERTVLALRFTEPVPGNEVTAAVEVRRRNRAIRQVLTDLSGTPVLDGLTATGGTIMLKGQARADGLTTALAPVVGDRWAAGTANAVANTMPEAVCAAVDTAEVADRLALEPRVYDLTALRFEVQVTRPGPARAALADLVERLAGHPDLRETLAAYLACDGVRRETAKRLHLHVNTVDYRLSRVRGLTEVDPTTREGWQTLRAAVIAHRFVSAQ